MSEVIDTAWPRFRYHRELCPDGKVVKSLEENLKLGEGWVDSPAGWCHEVKVVTPDPIKVEIVNVAEPVLEIFQEPEPVIEPEPTPLPVEEKPKPHKSKRKKW